MNTTGGATIPSGCRRQGLMILAEGTGVALVRLTASVGGARKAGVADTFKPHVMFSDTVALPTLKKRSLCGFFSKGLQVFSGEFALHQYEGVDVPGWGVIIMQAGHELNLFAQAL